MTRNIFFTILLIIGIATTSVSQRKVNFIIQINEKLVVDGLSDIHLTFDSVDSKKGFAIDYVPGDLIISDEIWKKINLDTSTRFFLKFNYNTFTKGDQKTANFFVGLTKDNLMQRYLILNIYDFRNKKYKRWYQWHTDKEFLAELTFPNSGVYIRKL